jgi:uncharacterized RDD family membrane protein YckC
MPAAKPNLASWGHRLLASVLDAMVLFVALFILIAFGETLDLSSQWIAAVIPVAYIAYNSAALLIPQLSLGRTVAGISVVSVRGDGGITRVQAVARPLVRVLAFVMAFFVSATTDQPWLFPVLPLVVELALIAHTPWRQSMADFLAGTIVVNTPQPSPHRAPAGPMYSATDVEFGPRPRQNADPF